MAIGMNMLEAFVAPTIMEEITASSPYVVVSMMASKVMLFLVLVSLSGFLAQER